MSTSTSFFAGFPQKIPYLGPESKDPLSFRFYNADEVIEGKTMRDWCRFACCFWHTFRGDGRDPFGAPTISRSWEDGTDSLENAKRRIQVAFDFMSRLGVGFWTFHDRDIAPPGKSLAEANANLREVVAEAARQQQQTGIRLLWGTANLFGAPKFKDGASTSPDALVFAHAAAQVKSAMDATAALHGENYVFWGGREGFQSLLNTDMQLETSNLAAFLRMAAEYKKKIGWKGVLLIEPKPHEPSKHQYDWDAATTIGFLRRHGLFDDFMLNIEPNHTTLARHDFEHDIFVASQAGKLGSVDANVGDPSLGWDVDMFVPTVHQTARAWLAIMRQGGLAPGGLNFDAKLRRESTDVQDMFIAHIAAMDAWARGLRVAAAIRKDGKIAEMVHKRYESYESGFGARIRSGMMTFEELEKIALESGEPKLASSQQELYERIFDSYC